MANEPSTVTMNVSLPEPLKRYVDGKVASGIYGSASEFVREAIREKLAREEELERARDAFEMKLLDRLENDTFVKFSKTHFEGQKARLREKLAVKKSRA